MNAVIQIIHFTNETFGRAFIRRYRELPRVAWRSLRVTLVFSNKKVGTSRAGGLDFVWDALRFVLLRLRYRKPGISVRLVRDVNDGRFLQKIPPKAIGFCTGFNQIFKSGLLERPHPFVNVHPSLLPYYRGPIPSHWCLRNGEARTGFSFHRITEKIDAGEVLYQGIVEVGDVQSAAQLDEKIATAASAVFRAILLSIVERRAWPAQNAEDAGNVYAVKIGYRSFE